MVLVAVAGGTSPTLGRSVVTALVNTGKHNVVVLSRQKERADQEQKVKETSSIYGAPILPVDYDSTESLTTALQGVHTLISVIKVTDPDALLKHHSNMLRACHAAGVSRFAPSSWTLGPASFVKVDLLVHKKSVWELCEEMGVKNGIECASFDNGMFMNYFAQGLTTSNFSDAPAAGGHKEKEKEFALGGLVDDMMLEYIDIPRGKLVIPLDHQGKPSKISMTHLDDIGKFVAAAVDLPKGQWRGHLGMAGDTCTMEDVAQLLRARGVKIEHETITAQQCDEKVRAFDQQLAGAFSIETLIGKMVAQIMKVQCQGELGGGIIDPVLNRLCPDVKPVSIREFLDRVY